MLTERLDDLTIRFPARSGYLGVCRLNATAMAASIGFDVEQLDDLRLAVDEAVTFLLIDENPSGVVELTISCQDDQLLFRGSRSENDLPTQEPGDLVHAILGATVTAFETGEDEAGRRFVSLSKRV